jgi:hypothetical protein
VPSFKPISHRQTGPDLNGFGKSSDAFYATNRSNQFDKNRILQSNDPPLVVEKPQKVFI